MHVCSYLASYTQPTRKLHVIWKGFVRSLMNARCCQRYDEHHLSSTILKEVCTIPRTINITNDNIFLTLYAMSSVNFRQAPSKN